MNVVTLTQEYQSPAARSSIANWVGQTIGVKVIDFKANDAGETTSVAVAVLTPDDVTQGQDAKIESARMIRQLAAAGVGKGDVLIVHVAAYGKRGQVFAPPAENDEFAAELSKVLAK